MTYLLFPIVWAVTLVAQLVWWFRLTRPVHLDGLSARKLVAARTTAEQPDPWVVAAVLSAILLPVGVVLVVERQLLGVGFVALGTVLAVEAIATRRSARALLELLGDRGVLDLGPQAPRREARRRRAGLVALVSIALALLPFPAWLEADGVAPLVTGIVIFAVGMLTFFVAVVPYLVTWNRLYEARRRAVAELDRTDDR